MSWLTKESMEKWFDLLPEDVTSCMKKEDITHIETDENFSNQIENLKSGKEISTFVFSNADTISNFGRPKRIRFLAWIASRDYPDIVQTMQAITDEEGSVGSGGADGADKVAPLFLEDLRALVAALGPRTAKEFVDVNTLNAIKSAGLELANEYEMTSGGTL